MREQLFEILEELGVFFSDEEKGPANDVDLIEYVQDSYIRILFALQIEEKLGVVLDEDMLKADNLKSLNNLVRQLENAEPLA